MFLVIGFNLVNIIDLIILLILVGLLSLAGYLLSKRLFYIFIGIVCLVLNALFYIFELQLALSILSVLEISVLCCLFVVHQTVLSGFFKKAARESRVKKLDESLQEKFYDIVEETVLGLSKSRTGAIITFEKNENLDQFIQKGKPVNAKISSDLLRTIFYVGTPLHDGAVIIRGYDIEAASVYYNPTTSALPGKFGARHRAALGFSETHPSVTVVVSEETGKISFAMNGELIATTHDRFKNEFIRFIEK